MRQLFTKHDLEAKWLDKFLTPKNAADQALTTKINSPEKFWKLGVDHNEKRKVLAASAFLCRDVLNLPSFTEFVSYY